MAVDRRQRRALVESGKENLAGAVAVDIGEGEIENQRPGIVQDGPFGRIGLAEADFAVHIAADGECFAARFEPRAGDFPDRTRNLEALHLQPGALDNLDAGLAFGLGRSWADRQAAEGDFALEHAERDSQPDRAFGQVERGGVGIPTGRVPGADLERRKRAHRLARRVQRRQNRATARIVSMADFHRNRQPPGPLQVDFAQQRGIAVEIAAAHEHALFIGEQNGGAGLAQSRRQSPAGQIGKVFFKQRIRRSVGRVKKSRESREQAQRQGGTFDRPAWNPASAHSRCLH
ncbi:MAG: hypothetical protein BWZ10_03171 [candidate division BRC1 bacterium ADurb.BinA364]|nr:MAG: hypothetical protein BWZ10_03171 [candidate division BRC1 bacterium ADurb.BinA364]